jgi:GNAT superfamily N-acetyltransferase
MTIVFRGAMSGDARAIAEIDIACWRQAYAHILPVAYLDARSLDERTVWWEDRLEDDSDLAEQVFVALEGERVVGFAGVGRSRDPDGGGCGELGFIYVAPDRWRSGIGRELLRVGLDSLRDRGFQEATLWVFEANNLAEAFYEAEGWTPDGARMETSRWGAPVVRYRVKLAENVP